MSLPFLDIAFLSSKKKYAVYNLISFINFLILYNNYNKFSRDEKSFNHVMLEYFENYS